MNKLVISLITLVAGVLAIALAFGALNLLLVGGQWLWHYSDQGKLDLLNVELKLEVAAIESIEAKLNGLKSDMLEVDAKSKNLKQSISSVELEFPAGVPEEFYAAYKIKVRLFNESIGKHNAILSAYNAVYPIYYSQTEAHNRKVEQANALAKTVGTTWYVIPIPGVRSGMHFHL